MSHRKWEDVKVHKAAIGHEFGVIVSPGNLPKICISVAEAKRLIQEDVKLQWGDEWHEDDKFEWEQFNDCSWVAHVYCGGDWLVELDPVVHGVHLSWLDSAS